MGMFFSLEAGEVLESYMRLIGGALSGATVQGGDRGKADAGHEKDQTRQLRPPRPKRTWTLGLSLMRYLNAVEGGSRSGQKKYLTS